MARQIVTFADLVAIARRVGVKVVEAPSSHRGSVGEMGTVMGLTCHHTGTPNSYRPELEYPDFNVVKEGRVGLWNSLSAWGIGRYSTIYVFSEDLSWHAGEWLWNGITDGNGHFLGIEAAGIGDWTPFQRAVYPRLVASALLFINAGTNWAPRHLDGAMPRGRKSDAAHFEQQFLPGKNFYQSVQWLMDNPAHININYLEDDMPTPEEIASAVWGYQITYGGANAAAKLVLGDIFNHARLAAGVDVDEKVLAAELLPQLKPLLLEVAKEAQAAGSTVTAEEIVDKVAERLSA